MNLTAKISLIILATVSLLVGSMAWLDFQGERAVLGRLLDEQGKAITRIVASFGVEALLVRDYPVLETVLENVAEDNDRIESIEVRREGSKNAVHHLPNRSQGMIRWYPVIELNVAEQSSLGCIISTHRKPPRRGYEGRRGIASCCRRELTDFERAAAPGGRTLRNFSRR